MELLSDLLYGMKTGQYWFVSVAGMFYIFSVTFLLITQNKEFSNSEEQVKAMNFAARLVLASIAILIATVLFVVIPGPYLKYALMIVCAIIIVIMIKVDKLPIWEDRE